MGKVADGWPEGKGAEQLTLPGIDFSPPKVRRYGLTEAHTFPLVSLGKDASGHYQPPFRVHASRGWDFPELQFQTPNSIPVLILDVDRPDWMLPIFDKDVPQPNWATERRANHHAHIFYTLARAVLTGEQARPTPQAYLARVGEWLAAQLGADAAYNGVLAHNPMSKAGRGRYRTDWLRPDPYSLAELGEWIPPGWRRPQPRELRTAAGRNDHLFRAGMKWTGKPSHWGDWDGVAVYLAELNAGLVLPLGERELGGIVKSVCKRQQTNLDTGQTQRTFSFIQAGRGRKSGAARRERTADRDMAIVSAVQAGEAKKAVARLHGLSPKAIRKIVVRQGGTEPKQDDVPRRAVVPAWGKLGISRATFYRRLKKRGQVSGAPKASWKRARGIVSALAAGTD